MTSTYLGYKVYTNDYAKSLQRVVDQPMNAQAKAYFEENIGKVKNVDDFINNYRLFSYAMESYGLKDMTYAKALMRKVLTSDLSSSSSTANRLNDSRYRAFAQAFNFTSTGDVATVSVQSSAQQSATVAAFSGNTAGLDQKTADAATSYYKGHIGGVTSLAALEKDTKLYSYVMTAYGLSASTPKATFEAEVEGDLADPNSLVNKTAGAGYLALKQAVNVDTSGNATLNRQSAQSSDAIFATTVAYATAAGGDIASQIAASAESAYYGSAIGKVTSVDDLKSDSRLVAYIVQAFGLPGDTSATTLGQILTSDRSDPYSFANTADPRFKKVLAAFNFPTDGVLKPAPFQTADQQQQTVALYTARQTSDTDAADAATQYYRAKIGGVKSVGDLEADSKLLTYVLKAYGVDPGASKATIEHVLEDSLSSPSALVNQTAGSHVLALAAAFTVDAAGTAIRTPQAQSDAAVSTTTAAYAAAAKTDAASQAAAATETTYYKSAVASATTVGALLGDKRVVAYLIQAYGLPTSTTTGQLRQALTGTSETAKSGPADVSAAYTSLGAAFNFNKNGLITDQYARAQSASSQAATSLAYSQQVLEDQAGDQSTGVKLALYFKRVAPTITNAYGLLADKALLQVTQTLLGLSSTSSKADVDTQARYIKSKLNIADFKDPQKLDKLVQRFAVLYDLDKNATGASDQVSLLFGSNSN